MLVRGDAELIASMPSHVAKDYHDLIDHLTASVHIPRCWMNADEMAIGAYLAANGREPFDWDVMKHTPDSGKAKAHARVYKRLPHGAPNRLFMRKVVHRINPKSWRTFSSEQKVYYAQN